MHCAVHERSVEVRPSGHGDDGGHTNINCNRTFGNAFVRILEFVLITTSIVYNRSDDHTVYFIITEIIYHTITVNNCRKQSQDLLKQCILLQFSARSELCGAMVSRCSVMGQLISGLLPAQ